MGMLSEMSLRRPSMNLWLAALAAAAATACATTPATEPAAPKPATPAASTSAATPAVRPASFAICAACHSTTADAPPGLGPTLFNIAGKKAGSDPDYDYSPALKAWGMNWTPENLQAFVASPAKAVPGNKMDYPGVPDPTEAKAIADYIATLKP